MIVGLIIKILVGALIGWLASIFMKSSHGFWMCCLLGIIGSILGDVLAKVIGIGSATGVASFVISILGTCLTIAIARAIFGKKF